MNLKDGNGRVPIPTFQDDHPLVLVDWPDRKMFQSLYGPQVQPDSIDRYWDVLTARRDGATLADAGAKYGLSRERVRQIEHKFIALLGRHYRATALGQN